jgi:hypothetical protein
LQKLLNSSNENLRLIATLIISKKLISQKQLQSFYTVLQDPKFMYSILNDLVIAGDAESVLGLLSVLAQEDKRTFWRMYSSEVQELFRQWPIFAKVVWGNLDRIPAFVLEVFQNYSWLAEKVREEISPSSIAKLNSSQAELFVRLLTDHPQFLEDSALLRAVLIAPDAQINQFGAAYVKENAKFSEYWLVMLESNLPVTSKAAVAYLETQATANDFEENIMKALDSNNKFARSSALKILQTANSPKLLSGVIQKLAENRNPDTWGVVASNMNLIEEAKNLQTFTRRVFLSRRKARRQKEQVKNKITTLVRDLGEVVEQELLVRMSLGAVAKDRDWALRQIAQNGLASDDVTVEFTWKAGSDV